MPREAQRSGAWIEQACRALGWGLPTSRFTTREAPHRYLYTHMCGGREDAPTDYHYVQMVPNRNPCQTQGLPQAELRPGRFPTRRIATREALHKQNYDQGAYILPYLQAELLPGSWLAGWLAGWGDYDQETCHALGWLAGWLGGRLAGWLRPREAQRGPEMRSVERTSLSSAWLKAATRGLLEACFWDLGPSKKRLPNTYICELLRKLATGGNRGLLEAFFQELGPFKRAASQCVSC